MKLVALIFILLSLLHGCVYDNFDFQSKTFTRISVLYDAQISSVKYVPETGSIELEGYEGKSRIDAIIKALEAAR